MFKMSVFIGSLIFIFSSQVLFASTVVDEILKDYKSSTSFTHYLNLVQSKMLPGDDVFLYKKIKASPDLLQVKRLPPLTFDAGFFLLRMNKSEISFRLYEREKFEFEINGAKVIFHPAMVPSLRWAKLNEAIKPKSAFFSISFMPTAFAQQVGEATLSNVLLFSIISRLAQEATHGLFIKTENSEITFVQLMKKLKEYNSTCNTGYLTEFMKRMASLHVTSVKCEAVAKKIKAEPQISGDVQFEIPFGDNVFRKLYLNHAKQIVEEESPDFPGKRLVYKKRYVDSKADFDLMRVPGKNKVRALRQKGMEWLPVGEKSDEILERAEQMRELVNYTFSTDFCTRCGRNIQRAIKEIMIELEINPNVDQYGNPLPKDKVSPPVPPPAQSGSKQ